MSTLLIPIDSPIQPLQHWQEYLLVVAFAQSRSPNIKTALNIAGQARSYCQINIEGSAVNLAAFGKDYEQCNLALALLGLVTSWKGTHVFVNGRASHDPWRITQVLDCFQKSLRCNDSTAHCHNITDRLIINGYEDSLFINLFNSKSGYAKSTWLHPCSLIAGYYDNRLNPKHPASLKDQLQAQAVKHDCDWCPNFNANALKKI